MFHLTVGCVSDVVRGVIEAYEEYPHCKTYLHSYFKIYIYICSSGKEYLYKDCSHLSTLNIFVL